MKTEEIKELFSKFESIVCDYNGVECWSARELYKLLGYVEWRNFLTIVQKAKNACENAGMSISDHFVDVNKMIVLAKGAQRSVDNILLTRYACYLVARTAIHVSKKLLLPKTTLLYRLERQSLLRSAFWITNG